MPEQPLQPDFQPPDDSTQHAQSRREATDIRFGPILGVVSALGICLVLAAFAVERLLQWREQVRGPAAARPKPARLPAEPRLEPLESESDAERSFTQREEARRERLTTLGAAEEDGFVHVPIDRAMQRLASDLKDKSPPTSAGDKSRGLLHAGEANSGRVMKEATP